MNETELKELTLKKCLRCDGSCPGTWINKLIDHKIKCNCNCHMVTKMEKKQISIIDEKGKKKEISCSGKSFRQEDGY